MSKPIGERLGRASVRKRVPELLEAYVKSCRPPSEGDPKKNPPKFPNLAGFCRFIGGTVSSMEDLRAVDPALFGWICTVLEDEALNFSSSPTLLSAYLKRRLGYGDAHDGENGSAACGDVRLVFEHDIGEDGA